MDLITLAMAQNAKPQIIDLTKITAIDEGAEYSLSDELFGLLLDSLTHDGASRNKSVQLTDDSLIKQASTNRQIIVRVNALGNNVDYPTIKASNSEGVVGQMSFVGILRLVGDFAADIELRAVLQFSGSTHLEIMVKATPIT